MHTNIHTGMDTSNTTMDPGTGRLGRPLPKLPKPNPPPKLVYAGSAGQSSGHDTGASGSNDRTNDLNHSGKRPTRQNPKTKTMHKTAPTPSPVPIRVECVAEVASDVASSIETVASHELARHVRFASPHVTRWIEPLPIPPTRFQRMIHHLKNSVNRIPFISNRRTTNQEDNNFNYRNSTSHDNLNYQNTTSHDDEFNQQNTTSHNDNFNNQNTTTPLDTLNHATLLSETDLPAFKTQIHRQFSDSVHSHPTFHQDQNHATRISTDDSTPLSPASRSSTSQFLHNDAKHIDAHSKPPDAYSTFTYKSKPFPPTKKPLLSRIALFFKTLFGGHRNYSSQGNRFASTASKYKSNVAPSPLPISLPEVQIDPSLSLSLPTPVHKESAIARISTEAQSASSFLSDNANAPSSVSACVFDEVDQTHIRRLYNYSTALDSDAFSNVSMTSASVDRSPSIKNISSHRINSSASPLRRSATRRTASSTTSSRGKSAAHLLDHWYDHQAAAGHLQNTASSNIHNYHQFPGPSVHHWSTRHLQKAFRTPSPSTSDSVASHPPQLPIAQSKPTAWHNAASTTATPPLHPPPQHQHTYRAITTPPVTVVSILHEHGPQTLENVQHRNRPTNAPHLFPPSPVSPLSNSASANNNTPQASSSFHRIHATAKKIIV